MRKYKWIRGLSIFGIIVVSVLICVTLFVGMMLDGRNLISYHVESMQEIEATLKGNGDLERGGKRGGRYFCAVCPGSRQSGTFGGGKGGGRVRV